MQVFTPVVEHEPPALTGLRMAYVLYRQVSHEPPAATYKLATNLRDMAHRLDEQGKIAPTEVRQLIWTLLIYLYDEVSI